MTVHGVRGTKRTCQNEGCGVRFYDLMRSPITCPICHSPFVPPPARELRQRPGTNRGSFYGPSVIGIEAAEAPAKDLKKPLEPGEADDADAQIGPESTDVILEPEEDGDDHRSGILPPPVDQKD